MTDKLFTEPRMPNGSSDLERLAMGGKIAKQSAMVCVNVVSLGVLRMKGSILRTGVEM